MSAFCPECGSPLPSGAKSCGRCGPRGAAAPRRAGDPAYGLLDLDRDDAGPLALDVAEDPRARKNRPAGRPDSGPVRANTGAKTMRTPGGGATASGTARTQSGAKASASTLSASKSATLTASTSATKGTASSTSRSVVAHASSRTASTVVGVAGGVGSGSSRTLSASRPSSGPVEPPAWSGTMLGDDPLDQSFLRAADEPGLEIDEAADPRRRYQEDEPPPAPELSPGQQRAAQIVQLAQYGDAPKNIFGTMGYWVRVTLRKRLLDEELAALSAQRKRTDDAAREALAKLGEALHSKRRDPRLATLARQLEAVSSADAAIGSAEQAGAKRKKSLERERVQLETETKTIETDAAPLRERVAVLTQHLEKHRSNIKRAETQRRKLEQEIEGLRKKPGADPGTHARLKAERDAAHGDAQTLGLQLAPLEDDLAVVSAELGVHLRKLEALQQGQQAASSALERAHSTQRVSTGSARGARRDALSALAQIAIDNGLAALMPDELKAVHDANERRDRKRVEEELHRAATGSFNASAYKQGMMLLVGGTGALLLSLVLVVIF